MTTKNYVIAYVVTIFGLVILVILFMAWTGLHDHTVDNNRIFPIIGTLANNASSTLSAIGGAWISYAFGKQAYDQLEERLKEALAEIARLKQNSPPT